MPDKPKDSKEGLGASIAGDFDDPDEDLNEGSDENNEDGDGGSGDSEGGKPEGEKDKKDGEGKDDKDGDDAKVTMTKGELTELVKNASTEAVNSAVASVNSTKDKQLQAERQKSAEERERILRDQEESRLSGLTGDDRARMQTVIDTDRAKREATQEKADAAEMYRVAKVERGLAQYARFGVTEEQLQGCESETEMLQLCLQAERQYWEDIAMGRRRPDDDNQNQQRRTKKDKPAGSQKKTDIGGGGAGGPTNKGNEQAATTLADFGKGLAQHGVVPGGGIERAAK